MLVTDSEAPARYRAVEAGSLATVSMSEVLERRRAAGGDLPERV